MNESNIITGRAIEPAHRIHFRILDHRVGRLLTFGAPLMKDGIVRVVNRF